MKHYKEIIDDAMRVAIKKAIKETDSMYQAGLSLCMSPRVFLWWRKKLGLELGVKRERGRDIFGKVKRDYGGLDKIID